MIAAAIRLFGIPIPSTDPVFLALVFLHVLFGPPAVAAGLLAMLSTKRRGRHSTAGSVYFWALTGLAVTMSILSFLRWPDDNVLFFLGAFAFVAALLGRLAIRDRRPRLHLLAMATSYVVMLVAFYVDNGSNLPLWRDLPPVAYWLLPIAVGTPIISFYLWRLPHFTYSDRKMSSAVRGTTEA